MFKGSKFRWAPQILIVSTIAMALGLADVRSSVAGCGGYCAARHVRALCHKATVVQGLKGHERDAEFEKCKADPTTYLQLHELADDLQESLD
jgi:hypothetical protein